MAEESSTTQPFYSDKQNRDIMISDFSKILEAYGYQSREKKLDFIRLIYLGGGFDTNTLIEDLRSTGHTDAQIEHAKEVVKQATSGYEYKNLQNFKPDIILDKLFHSAYSLPEKSIWPEKLHHWLLWITQREFFAREPGQERWQQKTGQWMKEYKSDVEAIIERLGIKNEVPPKLKFYEAICILGSTAPEIAERINFNKQILEEYGVDAPIFYFLTGERAVDANEDGQQYIDEINQKYGILPEKIIETDFMKSAVVRMKEHSKLFAEKLGEIIHAPAIVSNGIKKRPTTIDTIRQLSQEVPHLSGNVLFISRAPCIQSQHEDIVATVKKYFPNVHPETVGPKYENAPITRTMGAVGGALYGGYPRVALETGCKAEIEALEKERNKYNYATQLQLMREKQVTSLSMSIE